MPNESAVFPGNAWKNGFFSIGIELQRADVTARHPERAVAVRPHAADPVEAREDRAAVPARGALHAVVGELLVERAFHLAPLERLCEGDDRGIETTRHRLVPGTSLLACLAVAAAACSAALRFRPVPVASTTSPAKTSTVN